MQTFNVLVLLTKYFLIQFGDHKKHLSVETLRYISSEAKGNINEGQSNFVLNTREMDGQINKK